MELKILKEEKNPLFNRKEIVLELKADVTPSKIEAEKLVHEKFSVPIENIKIRKILGKFGLRVFIIEVFIYPSKEEKEKVERVKKKKIKEKTES